MTFKRSRLIALFVFGILLSQNLAVAQLPLAPDGFRVTMVAQEPVVRNPCSMAFGQKGRLFVGMGPQYRNPTPKTPGDRVAILIDKDGDGEFDRTKTFAEGFNNIQALAWHGNDLWVANAPDLTVVRDNDGDDVADEYILIYTDLGNLEHGLHGLCWGPNGRLYMSKGNSKGLTKTGRIAPKPFRELWGVTAPDGSPDFPPVKKFDAKSYRHTYHDPTDDWGREGGVLVCDDMGKNLEIVSRGFRNPWDIAFDSDFNFQGTDNDQNEGDRVFMPFPSAHFGWGHSWSAHWTGKNHLPTAPITGPVFHGSGTGMIYLDVPTFPRHMRGVWMFNDWLRRTTFYYRPKWNGALLQPSDGQWNEFVRGGESLFKPTDIEVGPDGALYILGWGREYGATFKEGKQSNEGRIYRVEWTGKPRVNPKQTDNDPEAKSLTSVRKALEDRLKRNRERPIDRWTDLEVADNFGGPIPVWRVKAQLELIRRYQTDPKRIESMVATLCEKSLTQNGERWSLPNYVTWLNWTRGLITRTPSQVVESNNSTQSTSARVRAIRIAAHRSWKNPGGVFDSIFLSGLTDKEPRVRMAAVLGIRRANRDSLAGQLFKLARNETDRVVFYSTWQTLRRISSTEELRRRLNSKQAGERLAALLALAEDRKLAESEVRPLIGDVDERVREVAALWLSKSKGHSLFTVTPNGGEFQDAVRVKIAVGFKPADVRYTIDGSTPNATSMPWRGDVSINETTVLKAGLFVNGFAVGHVAEYKFKKLEATETARRSGVFSVQAKSGRPYQIVDNGALQGRRVYVDRPYTYESIPKSLQGLIVVQTSNEDSGSQGDEFLTIDTVIPTTVYFGCDTRITELPRWLEKSLKTKTPSFLDARLVVKTNDASFRIYERTFDAGRIVLGGNTNDGQGGGRSNYIVLIKPAGLPRLKNPTTTLNVLKLIKTANAKRGRALFFATTAAGCSKCHRTDGKSQGFGPDLLHLVQGKDAKHIVKSILEPSAEIKEGFTMQMYLTKRGLAVTGLLKAETTTTITLVQPNGSSIVLDKNDIDEKIKQTVSPMPSFDRLLNSQQVADITAWLLTQAQKP
jgi:putative membrane-bound dehydrogenase-like protein